MNRVTGDRPGVCPLSRGYASADSSAQHVGLWSAILRLPCEPTAHVWPCRDANPVNVVLVALPPAGKLTLRHEVPFQWSIPVPISMVGFPPSLMSAHTSPGLRHQRLLLSDARRHKRPRADHPSMRQTAEFPSLAFIIPLIDARSPAAAWKNTYFADLKSRSINDGNVRDPSVHYGGARSRTVAGA